METTTDSAKTPRNAVMTRLIAAMVLLLVLRCLGTITYHAASAPGGLFSIDFGIFYKAAERLNAHQPLYVHEHGKMDFQHVSSPLVPMLIQPLARHPLDEATRRWALVNTVLLTGALLLFCWGIGLHLLDDIVPVVLVVVTGFRFWPTTIELGIGNSNIIVLTLLCGMFVCDRYRKWFLFALLVALAALTKTWLIGLLFYPMVRRQWLAAAAGVAFFAGGLFLLFAKVGFAEFPAMLEVTRAYSSQPMLVSNSVAGMARMFFTNSPVMPPLFVSPACWGIVMVTGYGILVGGLGYLWWQGKRMNEDQARICLALTALALVLGSPVSHQYYFIFALPLLWVLLVGRAGRAVGWGVPVAAFVIYLIYSVPTPSLNPVPEAYRHGLKSLMVGTSLFAGMLLWIGGVLTVARGLRTPAPAGANDSVVEGGLASVGDV